MEYGMRDWTNPNATGGEQCWLARAWWPTSKLDNADRLG